MLRPEDLDQAQIVAKPVQDIDPNVLGTLASGDVLFVDCSQVAKVGSDVLHIYPVLERLDGDLPIRQGRRGVPVGGGVLRRPSQSGVDLAAAALRPAATIAFLMKIYTRTGDDGTTGLFYGGRVAKDSELPWAYGTVDEAQAALGMARTHTTPGGELDALLVRLCRDLYVLMAELATLPENRVKLAPGTTLVTEPMVTELERLIDDISSRFDLPTEFVIPGGNPVGAALDVARTVARRAERLALRAVVADSHVVPYLNRLSDLLWTLARWQEGTSLSSRSVPNPAG